MSMSVSRVMFPVWFRERVEQMEYGNLFRLCLSRHQIASFCLTEVTKMVNLCFFVISTIVFFFSEETEATYSSTKLK